MKPNPKPCFWLFGLAAVTGSIILSLLGQPVPSRPRELTKIPTEFGQYLLGDCADLRRHLSDEEALQGRLSRGVVSVLRQSFLVDHSVEEYPTNTCPTVERMLETLGVRNRRKPLPQIRIIQRDEILQSSLWPWTDSNGYSPRFLQHELSAGDIIILTLHHD